ncbi:hypothetical protein SAMN04487969_10679 [Paenibacillus algorifonticola]|uniref:Uncharacterized protein n=1 Tax=Paenibacillus algorifonticola TaxID=684063 RepID=A0A1I2D4P6_9BACL|nr:hypothetical protein SAMN04487969_10679 [Paenibacillus algorifonticola]
MSTQLFIRFLLLFHRTHQQFIFRSNNQFDFCALLQIEPFKKLIRNADSAAVSPFAKRYIGKAA